MTRSLDEPLRDWSWSEMWESGLAMKLIGQWDNGRSARQRGLPRASHWKPETLYHDAWTQGFNGEPLSIWTGDRSPVAPRQESRTAVEPARASESRTIDQADSALGHPVAERQGYVGQGYGGDVMAIDLLNLLVRCFHAGQPSEVHAVRGFLITVANAIKTLKPSRVVIATDAGYEHRLKLSPAYKANRPPKPPGLQEQIDLALDVVQTLGWPIARVAGFEADDVLASLCRVCPSVTVITNDKDLQQLHGRARIWRPFGGGFVTPETVRETWGVEPHQLGDVLALSGDGADGVPGVEGIGPKTAAELLVKWGDLETVIAQAALGTLKGRAKCLAKPESRERALLCRKLVELVDTLPVSEWLDASPAGPRSTWQQRLQELRLFAAIKPLSEAFESLSVGGTSQPTGGTPTATPTPRRPVTKSLF